MKQLVVLFDFDGTLCDSERVIVPSFNEISKKYGFKPIQGKDELSYLKSMSTSDRMKYSGIRKRDFPKILIDIRNKMSEKISEFVFFDGLYEELCKFKDHNVILGILSSNKKENIQQITKHLGASDLFKYLDAGMSFHGKSSRLVKLRKKIIKDSSLNEEDFRFVYVGDEVRDMEAAKEVGISTVAVCWGLYAKSLLAASEPDVMVEEVGRLFQSVISLNAHD